MMDTTSDDKFATVICGALDTTAGTLTVARAGHPDLLVIDGDGARYLDVPLGPPVGVDTTWAYQSVTHVLPDGATLLAYTDGLIERRREHPDIGLERLRVAALADLPIDELVAQLVDSLVTVGDDDVAVLALHWTRLPAPVEVDVVAGAPARSISLPSDPRAARTARRFVRDTLSEWGLDDVDQVAELLTDELVGNVVRHVGSPMEVRAWQFPETIRIEVDDASTQPPIRRHPEQLDEHGRGILFVETLATDWGVEVREEGKTIWFELPATPTGELPVECE